MRDLPLQVPGTCKGTQTLLTINQPLSASSMVWLRLLLETDSIFTQPSLASEYKHEWASAVCTAIPHLSVQFVQSVADAIEYNWEWAAAVCTAVPH